MINQEDAEKKIAKAKVTFVISETDDGPRAFTPHFAAKKKPNYRNIEKKIKSCLRESKFQEVASYFSSAQEMEDFYKKSEGQRVFGWALTSIENDAPLKYLIANVPQAIVHNAFAYNNFSLLKGYLGGEDGMQEDGYSTEESRLYMSKKLEALLQLGDRDISALIKGNVNEKVRQLLTLSP